jgi:hypothetical protein
MTETGNRNGPIATRAGQSDLRSIGVLACPQFSPAALQSLGLLDGGKHSTTIEPGYLLGDSRDFESSNAYARTMSTGSTDMRGVSKSWYCPSSPSLSPQAPIKTWRHTSMRIETA